MAQCRNTLPIAFAVLPMSTVIVTSALPTQCRWSFHQPAMQHSATVAAVRAWNELALLYCCYMFIVTLICASLIIIIIIIIILHIRTYKNEGNMKTASDLTSWYFITRWLDSRAVILAVFVVLPVKLCMKYRFFTIKVVSYQSCGNEC